MSVLLALILVCVAPRPAPLVIPAAVHASGTDPASGNLAARTRGTISTALIGGYATWYEDPRASGRYAAAGPALRRALGNDWRGSLVRVDSRGRSVVVVIRDWCACGDRHGRSTLLDLSPAAFAELAPLSRGVIPVSIELGGRVPAPPATDSE